MWSIRKVTIAFAFLSLFLFLRRVTQNQWSKAGLQDRLSDNAKPHRLKSSFPFIPGRGRLKPPGSNYTRLIVLGKTEDESISWMDKELPHFERKVYLVDNLTAPLHTPANKGNEALVYLSYLIDHYDELPDVMIFIHYHQYAWHNNALLNNDIAETIERLNSERVIREGYMNLRCEWFPGCPDWIRPRTSFFDKDITEQFLISKSWPEIFPVDPIPEILAQPCCSQFAVSKELVRSIEKDRYIHYRDWILKTDLTDNWSGRVWEYIWHYALTGHSYNCPLEHICYCDGYGICFGNTDKYEEWVFLRRDGDRIIAKLDKWKEQARKYQEGLQLPPSNAASQIEKPEEGLDLVYKNQIRAIKEHMDQIKFEASQRGKDPAVRALESGLDGPSTLDI